MDEDEQHGEVWEDAKKLYEREAEIDAAKCASARKELSKLFDKTGARNIEELKSHPRYKRFEFGLFVGRVSYLLEPDAIVGCGDFDPIEELEEMYNEPEDTIKKAWKICTDYKQQKFLHTYPHLHAFLQKTETNRIRQWELYVW